jgi:lysozyme family protein
VSERRRDFYRSLSTFKKFGRGWLNRVDMAQTLAMHLWATQSLRPE